MLLSWVPDLIVINTVCFFAMAAYTTAVSLTKAFFESNPLPSPVRVLTGAMHPFSSFMVSLAGCISISCNTFQNEMPFKSWAVSFLKFIPSFGYAGNTSLVVLPWQFNRMANKYAIAINAAISSVSKIASV